MLDPYNRVKCPGATVDTIEEDCVLAFTRNDLIRYAGPDQIIATALMFQLFKRAFAELAASEKIERNTLKMQVGFPGPGIMDCIELVLRGTTRNKTNVTIVTDGLSKEAPEAPEAPEGRFYFEFEYKGIRIGLWPVAGFFTDEFRVMVVRFQPRKGNEVEQATYQKFKTDLATRIMNTDPSNLFQLRYIDSPD